ncbi:MAG: helix-turn-helix domain-containing protein [Clostridiales bacterium]|nr:helix-turn-helix domain-containing protein [Candidatus Blautia equi]
MNLSAKLVLYKLKQYFMVSSSSRISAQPCLKYPVLYQNSLPLKDNLIYVIDDPAFILHTHNLGNVMLILVGKHFRFPFQSAPNICRIESDASAAWVLQVLQETFQVYNEWQQNIFQLMSASASVQKLLELSADAITNPITIIGMDFTILGSTVEQTSHLRNNVLGSNDETLSVVNALKKDPNYINAEEKSGFFYFPGNDYALPSLCVNIHSHGKTAYRLLIIPGDMPLDDTIGFLAVFLAAMAEQIIHSYLPANTGNPNSLHHIFLNMLTNPKTDYVVSSHELTSAGWMVAHTYLCVLLQTGYLDNRNLTLKSICNYVENQVPESCAIELNGNAVIFINLTLTPGSQDDIQQFFAEFIRDNFFIGSYSRSMMGHFNFYRQYQQARLTMEIGQREHPDRWVHHFNDIALTYCLEQITRKLPPYMVSHEKLLQLRYLDDSNDSQLYQTLRCYLENHQSATKTAQAMYIHRSTLLYRLDRIRNILKSDLTDPNELLYLLLSYHLNDYEDAKKL